MIKYDTISGSHYTIDTERKQWYRPSNADSMEVRTSGGEYVTISPIVVGEPVTIVCPPIVEGALARIITTSAVKEIYND
jgi:hypothetical protein